MKIKLFISLLLLAIIACSDDNNCANINLNATSLETEYECLDTRYQIDINLSNDYTIIRNQTDFDNLVSGSCEPTIDFSKYDLVIGKKGLLNGNSSIDYQLVENCKTNNLLLQVTFFQNETTEAPNLTYHSLIPNLVDEQTVDVKIIVQ
jgi:hypothetical protein